MAKFRPPPWRFTGLAEDADLDGLAAHFIVTLRKSATCAIGPAFNLVAVVIQTLGARVPIGHTAIGVSQSGWAWRRLIVKCAREPVVRGVDTIKSGDSYLEAFRRSKDPLSFMVLLEDSAALLGIVVAFLGTWASAWLQGRLWMA